MIDRDFKEGISSVTCTTGQYCVGFTSRTNNNKYFHVKLGPRSIICGYENLFNVRVEFTYKCISNVDAYGIRKAKIRRIFSEAPNMAKQMSQYTIEYYHKINS